jgi:hypothetical protein
MFTHHSYLLAGGVVPRSPNAKDTNWTNKYESNPKRASSVAARRAYECHRFEHVHRGQFSVEWNDMVCIHEH